MFYDLAIALVVVLEIVAPLIIEQESIMLLIRGLFASSLQETLRISALFAAFAAILALFYRKNDARSE